MTDEKQKQIWTRCNGCQQRVYNHKLDIDAHRLNCPYDLKLKLQKTIERLDTLEQSVEALETAGPVELPQVDINEVLDTVAPWPGNDTGEDDELDGGDTITTADPDEQVIQSMHPEYPLAIDRHDEPQPTQTFGFGPTR